MRQLKAFDKVALKAGETRRVTLRIPAASLGFHDAQGRHRVEPGRFQVFVGGSSLADLRESSRSPARAGPAMSYAQGVVRGVYMAPANLATSSPARSASC